VRTSTHMYKNTKENNSEEKERVEEICGKHGQK
jgi:hypothetical protein